MNGTRPRLVPLSTVMTRGRKRLPSTRTNSSNVAPATGASASALVDSASTSTLAHAATALSSSSSATTTTAAAYHSAASRTVLPATRPQDLPLHDDAWLLRGLERMVGREAAGARGQEVRDEGLVRRMLVLDLAEVVARKAKQLYGPGNVIDVRSTRGIRGRAYRKRVTGSRVELEGGDGYVAYEQRGETWQKLRWAEVEPSSDTVGGDGKDTMAGPLSSTS